MFDKQHRLTSRDSSAVVVRDAEASAAAAKAAVAAAEREVLRAQQCASVAERELEKAESTHASQAKVLLECTTAVDIAAQVAAATTKGETEVVHAVQCVTTERHAGSNFEDRVAVQRAMATKVTSEVL